MGLRVIKTIEKKIKKRLRKEKRKGRKALNSQRSQKLDSVRL